MKQRWYGRDIGLQFRMGITMLLLTFVYIVFAFVLFRYTHIGAFVFILPLVGLFLQYWFADKLVLAAARAKVVTAQQEPHVYGLVERLAQQADLPMPKVAIIQSQMPNAFATGRNPKHAIIAVTSGLMSQLPDSEIEAVLGHELTHVRNHDMLVMTMAGSFAAVASWIMQMGFWFGLGGDNRRGNGSAPFMVIIAVSLAVSLISHFLILSLSRYREYAADRGSALLTGQPEQLESALMRISGTMQRIPTRDLRDAERLSALFFAAPRKQSFMEIFSDHPSLQHRIAHLQRLQQQMAQH